MQQLLTFTSAICAKGIFILNLNINELMKQVIDKATNLPRNSLPKFHIHEDQNFRSKLQRLIKNRFGNRNYKFNGRDM